MVLIFMSGGNKKEIKSKAQAMKIDSCSQLSRFRVPFCDFIRCSQLSCTAIPNFWTISSNKLVQNLGKMGRFLVTPFCVPMVVMVFK